jgi:ABC-type glycerol-3-phosphate transport system permease component
VIQTADAAGVAGAGFPKKKTGLGRYLFQKRLSRRIYWFFYLTLIVGICFTILYPLIQLIPSVFSELSDLGNPNISVLPLHWSTLSLPAAWTMMMTYGPMTMPLSLLYAGAIMVVQVMISAMAGYSLARVNFPGRNIIFFLVIFTFLVPNESLLISQYIRFKHFDIFGLFQIFTGSDIDLIDQPVTLFMMALFGFGLNQSLFIFIFRQFFRNAPKELEEAALIDGCGFYSTYFKIMLANAKPAILTVGILSFVWNYADTYYTSYFNPSGPYLSVILDHNFALANMQQILNSIKAWYGIPNVNNYTFDAVRQAAAIIYLFPLLVLYSFFQKKLVENLEMSGIVG